MYFQVPYVIDVIDNELINTMEVDFGNNSFGGVLWKLGSKDIKDYDKAVTSLTDLGSYTKSACMIDLDLTNRESPTAKQSIIKHLNMNFIYFLYIFIMYSCLRILLFQHCC